MVSSCYSLCNERIFVAKAHVHKVQAHDDEILTSVKSEDVDSGKKAIRKGVEGAAHMGKNIGKILASVNSQDASSELNPKRNGVEGDVNVETNIDQIFTSVKSEDLNSEISAVTGVEDVNVGADDNEILRWHVYEPAILFEKITAR